MRLLLLFILTLPFSHTLFSQAQVIDLGKLTSTTQRYADITIRNNSELTAYLKQVEHSPQVVYRTSQETIKPDSTFVMRVQVNPDKKGAFNYVLRFNLSSEEQPIEIRLIGEVQEIPNYEDGLLQKCPEFSSTEKQECTEITLKAVDVETGEAIPYSTITILENGVANESWVTGSLGTLRKKSCSGFLYFVLSYKGYLTTETGIYITSNMETILIPMKKDPSYSIDEENGFEENENELATQIPDEKIEETLSEQLEDEEQDSILQQSFAELADYPLDYFESSVFKPVNVVFVLDLSSSMKVGEKINLMKYALNQLLIHLREEDKIGFVTYDQHAEIAMKLAYCTDKYMIRKTIEELQPEGDASTTKGIRLGYKHLIDHYSTNRANMIIVITDGAFNKNSNDYKKIVQKYAEQNITFSVVGIQCTTSNEKSLREAATFGDGRFIPIHKLSDAQYNLLQEIRIASFRGI